MTREEEKLFSLLREEKLLSKNEVAALGVLLADNAGAEKILAKTTVSTGRIYRVLGELEKKRLIEKVSPRPAIYSTKNFVEKVRLFLDYSFGDFVAKQQVVARAISDLDSGVRVRLFSGNREEYDAQIMKMFQTAKWIRILHKHVSFPWFLYPEDRKDFLKMRGVVGKNRSIGSSPEEGNLLIKREAYLRLYEEKPVEHLMARLAWEDYLVLLKKVFPEETEQIKNDLKKRLVEKKTVKIFLLEKFMTPFSIYLSDKQALMPLFFGERTSQLLIFEGREIVKTYGKYLDAYRESAKELVF